MGENGKRTCIIFFDTTCNRDNKQHLVCVCTEYDNTKRPPRIALQIVSILHEFILDLLRVDVFDCM